MKIQIKPRLLVASLLLTVGCGACNNGPHSHEKLCHVSVNLSMKQLEDAADRDQTELSEIQKRHAEGVRRQQELMAQLQSVARSENLRTTADEFEPLRHPADVIVEIGFSMIVGRTQRTEIVWYQDGKTGHMQSLNLWAERLWPTPQEKNYSKALGFDLQQSPISTDDVLRAVSLWRASQQGTKRDVD